MIEIALEPVIRAVRGVGPTRSPSPAPIGAGKACSPRAEHQCRPREPRAPVGSLGAMSFDIAIHQWREGERRLADAPPTQRQALDRVVDAIHAELRRRLGGAFTTDELADLYDGGTDWALDVAVATAPNAPWAWDARVVTDAAFGRYVREAADYAGGRRIETA